MFAKRINLTMHHTFAIIDSTTLLTGSGNWSKTSFARYDEDLLIFKDEQANTDSFRQEFEGLWATSHEYGKTVFKPTLVSRKKRPFGRVKFTSANMVVKQRNGEPIFSATEDLPGACESQLIDSIGKAETSIKIATTHFRRKDIADALNDALDRGVKVQLLLDQQEHHPVSTSLNNVRFDEELAAKGASLRYKCYTTKWTY